MFEKIFAVTKPSLEIAAPPHCLPLKVKVPTAPEAVVLLSGALSVYFAIRALVQLI